MTLDSQFVRDRVESAGFSIVPGALDESDNELWAARLERVSCQYRAGVRNLFQIVPALQVLPRKAEISRLVKAILGPGAFAVRVLLFDKSPNANWKVAWHQDLTVSVRKREDVLGYGPWSEKESVPHVQPPVAVLEQMLAVRVHLDDCGPDNGPLRVLPGSHLAGKLDRAAIEDWQRRVPAVTCLVPRGGLVLMRPLLLHASSAARAATRRRVLHLEFAAAELASPLAWFENWPIRA